MIFEGVNFVESACVPMGKEEFVKKFSGVHYQDRQPDERERMLSDAYDLMSPPEKEDKRKPAKKAVK